VLESVVAGINAEYLHGPSSLSAGSFPARSVATPFRPNSGWGTGWGLH
jgi:hypothetical protein